MTLLKALESACGTGCRSKGIIIRAWFASKSHSAAQEKGGRKELDIKRTEAAEEIEHRKDEPLSLPQAILDRIPTTTGGSAFPNDLRSTSALGVGDGKTSHTEKWLQGHERVPLQYISKSRPIKVNGLVVASRGSDNPALGCPVEYISLKGTSQEKPAVCKYTGNKFYSDDWKHGGAH